jgi:hypothetical protein
MGERCGVFGMLVVTANWAIDDGSLWRRPLRGLLPRAWGSLQRAALRAGFRRDGRYEPVERIDMVFAGDTFDLLGSRHWADREQRPWHRSTAAASIRRQVATAAIRRAAGLTRLARQLLAEGLAVPAATPQGRPHLRLPVSVPVSITLLTGDRDGWLVPTRNWPAGLHWADSWSDDRWQVEHGQRFDPLQGSGSGQPGEPPSLVQSLAVGLVARFATAAEASLSAPTGPLRLLADSHPLDLADTFWHQLLPRVAAGSIDLADRLADRWKRCVAAWRQEAVCEQVDVAADFDFIGRLATVLGTPGEPGRASGLLADLCGPSASHRQANMTAPPTAGLILGHLDEAVATAAWSPLTCRCLGLPPITPANGLVPGETVGVSLVNPASRPLSTHQPRALMAVETDCGDHLEMLDLAAGSPAVVWRPDRSLAAGPSTARRNEAA